MAVGGLLDTGLVSLTRLQSHQDLVVTEVACWVEREVLISVLVRQAQSHRTVKDQVELAEMLKSLNDGLVGDENTTVEGRNEEGEEFSSSVIICALIIYIAEYVFEIVNHRLEQRID